MRHIYMSTRYPQYADALSSLGCSIIPTVPNHSLPKPVCDHADMLSCFLDEHTAVIHQSQFKAFEKMQALGMSVTLSNAPLSSSYPDDIRLNCLIMNNKAYCRSDYVDSEIGAFADRLCINIKTRHVRQGYACCSVLKINDHAAITADEGLFKAMSADGADVLKISAGNIFLDGYDYGFIGGCSGYIGGGTVAFCGNLMRHPDGERIAQFLKKHNFSYICLSDGELCDIGGLRLCI